jgi:2-dehydropantoate 2-reductase
LLRPVANLAIRRGLVSFLQTRSFNTTYTLRKLNQNAPEIHVLGIGNIGKVLAHGLSKSACSPGITLLFHRPTLLNEWAEEGCRIEVVTRDIPDQSTGYKIQLVQKSSHQNVGLVPDKLLHMVDHDDGIIKNLIIGTKNNKTVAAIKSVKHRLNSDSTILFTQNGIGIVDEVTGKVFPDPLSRPRYAGAITTHAIYNPTTFSSVHAGVGKLTVGMLSPTTTNKDGTLESEGHNLKNCHEFLQTFPQAPTLYAREVSTAELLATQFEKLIINSLMSPLSVVLDCNYGGIFHSPDEKRNRGARVIARRLLEEMSAVILTIFRPTEVGVDLTRFDPDKLEAMIMRTAEFVASSYASMLQDVRAAQETEIDYIAGYIVQKGKELGLDVSMNETMIDLVKRIASAKLEIRQLFDSHS